MRTITVGTAELTVEVAETAAEQKLGLSYRATLSPEEGMLFPLADQGDGGFWMKDMNFSLDFIYLNEGRVVEIKERVKPEKIPIPFYPNESVDAVLEVNAGYAASHDIKVGDIADYTNS